jgi:hypothetical protein
MYALLRLKKNSMVKKQDILLLVCFFLCIIVTIIYGQALEKQGIQVRLWNWTNLLIMLPLIPLAFMQKKAGLPTYSGNKGMAQTLKIPVLAGIIFGLLDVLVIKVLLHPEPYTSLPPFLQPFPYSVFLFTSGALDVELYYRLLPSTLLLLASPFVGKGRYRKAVVIFLAVVTSLIEPIMQLPTGSIWLILYSFITGLAMNGLQFYFLIRSGFMAQLSVRLGHYLIWHILLGIYVQFFELV